METQEPGESVLGLGESVSGVTNQTAATNNHFLRIIQPGATLMLKSAGCAG